MINPKRKYELFRQNKNFCVVPWTSFEVWTNGDIKTCSVGNEVLGNINNSDINSIMNSKSIKRIRTNMLNNKADVNCRQCHHRTIQEDNFTYLRDHYNSKAEKEDINYDDIKNFDIRFIDLHWSNICNLRCTMCDPNQSSLIAKDEKVIIEPVNDKSIESIIKLLSANESNLQEIYMSGGEPFYIPHNVKLLQTLSNKDIPLRINTNMHWNKNNKLFKELLKYNNVQLTMSVDALYEKFNYIRNGSDWNTFIENFKFIKQNTNFELRMNSIFSVMNAIDLSEVIDYFYHGIGIKDITINTLHRPKEIDSRNYPTNKKISVVKKLQKILKTIDEQHVNLIGNIKNCISQIMLPNNYSYEQRLEQITKKHLIPWKHMFKDLT